jgi:putative heme-binding domain-containing protein
MTRVREEGNVIFRRMFVLIALMATRLCFALNLSVRAGDGPPDHPPPLSPQDELKKLKVAQGLEIKLVAAEPQVAQPLSITFDDRGRMWVLQYRQYPDPNGLKPVAVDQYLRTKYERLPEPPPAGPKGKDRISIYEDTDGDGRADVVRDFLTDLNLASGMALGYGGVFVVQPPYLLFYPDRDGDDHPDGPPKVLLTGFGMEDAHAFANSLTWGPDGWLYGAQGSTVTADIRGIGFQQGIWRYHPRWDRFELFSEGGGNTWGVEFDRYGNLFPAGNTAEPLEHHVQGAYLVKGFGKHGPLHNPHTYGYFQPVLHHGYLGDSLSGGAIIYQGGAFPARFDNACICPHTRHSACRWATIETRGSTFATRAAGDFITSGDIWFRPVDMTGGPDGALYIADWYDYNISHSSPKNRSQWYQPSRLDGRVWRVAPPSRAPLKAETLDLSHKSSDELVALLSHRNDWYARQARRLLAERCDQSVLPALAKLALSSDDERLALEGLWSLYVVGALDAPLAEKTLASPHEYVRAWTVRLIGDDRIASPDLLRRFIELAARDSSVVVRCQLACTAKRLPASQTMPIVEQLLRHDEDADDVQMPLLIWWAIEDKAISDSDRVLALFRQGDLWHRPLMARFLIERLARRFLSEGTNRSAAACATLVERARQERTLNPALSGMLAALSGRKLDRVPGPLERQVTETVRLESTNPRAVELALRLNLPGASQTAIRFAANRAAPMLERIALVSALGESKTVAAIDTLLSLVTDDSPDPIKIAALSALGYFRDDHIPDTVLDRFSRFSAPSRARSIELLCTRASWSLKLAASIDRKAIPAEAVPRELVQRLRQYDDQRLRRLIEKYWGKVRAATPFETQGRLTAVLQSLSKGKGDAARGRHYFEKTCANCHKLHGSGAAVGPDLTGAERKNRELLIQNIVDPSAVIRQEYTSHVAVTKDGRVVTGLLAESTPELITLVDAKNQRTVLERGDLEELKESPVSMMPEKLLDDMTDQQIRDLVAYVQSD